LATKVLPETQTIPPLELIIAGTSPPSKLKQLNSERVQITGWIPDMRWAYHQAQIFVAPLRIGTGQQNKILEAMACGIPCITTSHVMSGFLSEQAKQTTAPPLVIADSLEEMVRAIDSLVSDQAKRKQLGEASRKWIEENASWDIQSRILMDSFVHSSKL
jgi:glycosyltransferase involved in cell wall biosynthesis